MRSISALNPLTDNNRGDVYVGTDLAPIDKCGNVYVAPIVTCIEHPLTA